MTDPALHPYAAGAYARALAAAPGRAVGVPEWGGFVLARPIPGAPGFDALGVYPMTPISPEADLAAGLERLRGEGLVSVVLVPDPLASPATERLAAAFPLCRPFKTHYVVDRDVGDYAPNKHHRQEIRRAQRRCRVKIVPLREHLAVWTALYGGLVARHGIGGIAAFDDGYFAMLADDPRIVAFAAFVGEEVSAMTLWFQHADAAYNHLGASNAVGYANGANYALYDAAIGHFDGARRLNLGGSAGGKDDPADGLAFFKRGFANAEAQAMLCGATLDAERYAALAAGKAAGGYFPAYRG